MRTLTTGLQKNATSTRLCLMDGRPIGPILGTCDDPAELVPIASPTGRTWYCSASKYELELNPDKYYIIPRGLRIHSKVVCAVDETEHPQALLLDLNLETNQNQVVLIEGGDHDQPIGRIFVLTLSGPAAGFEIFTDAEAYDAWIQNSAPCDENGNAKAPIPTYEKGEYTFDEGDFILLAP